MRLLSQQSIYKEYRRLRNAKLTAETKDMFFSEAKPGSPDWHFLRGAQQALGWALGDLSVSPSRLVAPKKEQSDGGEGT